MIPAPAAHLYKYQSAEHLDRLRHLLLNHELYLPTVTELNDPADCRPRLVSASPRCLTRFVIRVWAQNHPEATLLDIAAEFPRAYGGLQQMGMENALRAMTTQLHEHADRLRVFSISKRWNNMNLWAKYASNHSGYCLEFRNTGIFTLAREVEYNDVIDLDVTSPTAAAEAFELFFRKKMDWSTEEEVRLLGHPSLTSPQAPFDPQ